MSLQSAQASIIHNNLKANVTNYKDLTLPKYTQEQIEQIKKGGEYAVFSAASFDKYTSDIKDKLEKGYLTEIESKNYIEDTKNIEKAIKVDEKGNEEPIYFYSLVEKVESIAKSESGEETTIQKSQYKDNPLNRKFDRVGKELPVQQ